MTGELQIVLGLITFSFVILYSTSQSRIMRFGMKYLFMVMAIATTLSLTTLSTGDVYLVNLYEVEIGFTFLLLILDFYKDIFNIFGIVLLKKKIFKDSPSEGKN